MELSALADGMQSGVAGYRTARSDLTHRPVVVKNSSNDHREQAGSRRSGSSWQKRKRYWAELKRKHQRRRTRGRIAGEILASGTGPYPKPVSW